MYLAVSIVLFLIFLGNILMGVTSGAAFLSDVAEMLLLVATSVSFVAAILAAERKSKQAAQHSSDH